MSKNIPLNTNAVTDKVRRGLTGNPARVATAATTLGAALRGDNTTQPDPESSVDGTGFGLSPSHKTPATDPSQGRSGKGNQRPKDNRDPLLTALQNVLHF